LAVVDHICDMTSELTLVPPGRLAALLSTARRRNGIDTATLAQQSNGQFSVAQLDEIERGRVLLQDDDVETLTELYEVNTEPIVPERSRLILDLGAGRMAIGDTGIAVGTGTGDVDEVLERYLSLLYIMRGLEPGSDLTLRDRDLTVLGETLQQELRVVERRLGQLMSGNDGEVKKRAGLLGRRFSLPAAGLLVALGALGSLVIVGGGGILGETTASDALVDNDPVAAQIDTGGLITPSSTEQAAPTGKSLMLPASFGQAASDNANSSDHAEVAQVAPAESGALTVSFTESAGQPASTFQAEVEASIAEVGPADASAEAPTVLAAPETVNQFAQIGAEAEALIAYDWESALPGWTIEYVGDTPGYRGLTHTPSKAIAIYVNDGDTAQDVAGILAHEIGHAIDVEYLDDSGRGAWLEARGMPRAWWPGNGLGDFHVGAGDWAEAVASLIAGSPSDSAYGDFTPDQLNLVSQLLPGGGATT